jgi:hypothetical protein
METIQETHEKLELLPPDQTTFRISNDLAKTTTNKELPPPLFSSHPHI